MERPHDLAELWKQVSAALVHRQVFPAIPVTNAVAEWPDGADWQSFLALADAVGALLLYAEVLAVPPLPSTKDPAVRHVAVVGHEGQIGRVALAFTYDGVLHFWQADTSWAALLDARERDDRDYDSFEEFGIGAPMSSGWVDWRTAAGEKQLEEGLGKDTLAAVIERCAQRPDAAIHTSSYALRSVLVDADTETQSSVSGPMRKRTIRKQVLSEPRSSMYSRTLRPRPQAGEENWSVSPSQSSTRYLLNCRRSPAGAKHDWPVRSGAVFGNSLLLTWGFTTPTSPTGSTQRPA